MRSRIVHHQAAFAELALLDAVDVALDGHLSLNAAFRAEAERHGAWGALAWRARCRRPCRDMDVDALVDAVRRLAPGLA